MTNKEIRAKVKEFRKETGLYTLNSRNLCDALQTLGYTVVEFNHIYNEPDVQTLIDALKLDAVICQSKAFTYADRNYRIVFVHEDLSEQEKNMVLTHEVGHIYLGHMHSVPILGSDVREEYDANEFSHYLLNLSVMAKLDLFLAAHMKGICILAAVIALAAAAGGIGMAAANDAKYTENYYITSTGSHYHEQQCIFVKNKTNARRMTLEEFDSGEFTRCSTCLP